jgi:hypothetical protein
MPPGKTGKTSGPRAAHTVTYVAPKGGECRTYTLPDDADHWGEVVHRWGRHYWQYPDGHIRRVTEVTNGHES